ncbi:MAG TPA: Na(+)-translocating NADH-quinone reductase subunit A [Bacteroidales bacterium]|nr:Na(+)-translocating NADH-quinone reductase subunit A [Bacteroidales bacterium]HRZ48729.1 Na(+)-translocating NADH-quinone reductase subunit A [Bacteroidales bacterium]
MTKIITIRKGLDIKLKGEAEHIVATADVNRFAVKPTDFHGVLPRLLVAEGDRVLAGTPLFLDKNDDRILFTAPVSGTVTEVRRGARRLLEAIVISADTTPEYLQMQIPDLAAATAEEIIDVLLKSGAWPFIRQRPYQVIAHPDHKPRAVFISAFDSSPLAPDLDFLIGNRGNAFQVGVDVLKKISGAPVHLNIHAEQTSAPEFLKAAGVQINRFKGPHPAGNVGIQIHHLDPVNKGEVVWTLNPLDVAMIGRLFLEKRFNTERVVALAGSEVMHPRYIRTHMGACVAEITAGQVAGNNVRYISGNVLTGTRIAADGFLGFYDHLITVIPEGNHHEFLGWAKPGLKAFSFSNAFPSKLLHRKPFVPDTNLHGGERAFVVTGQYEKVLPMDIYPVQLLKAILAKDIELMEDLGIYEVCEEDFALCEVICTSKIEVQSILREGLDMVRQEMS